MYLTIVLRKEITDEQQGQAMFEFVVDKIQPFPDVTITGQINSSLPLTPEEPT